MLIFVSVCFIHFFHPTMNLIYPTMNQRNKIFSGLLIGFLVAFTACQSATGPLNQNENKLPAPKNVILFIGDGMGFNQVLAANYYEYGEAGAQIYEQADWLKLAAATYPAVTRIRDNDTIYSDGYSPRLAWSSSEYLDTGHTGSAESATAISTGKKTFSPSIGIGLKGDTLVHTSQAAKALGKSIGVVTSVPLTHATPAGFAAHNHSRNNLGEIAMYMLFNTRLDLIMGAGNPDYNNDGEPAESSDRYIGSREIWNQLKANEGRTEFVYDGQTYRVQDANGDGQRDPWTFVESREDFLALSEGPTPARVLGVPKAYSTLHYGRSGTEKALPFEQPLNESVPTLKELTSAALNVLSQNPNGFFVMIEGGAIDWAGHDNHLGRAIEEQIDFNNAIRAAVEWVERNSSWDETMIIVTSDHETGYLTGPTHPNPVAGPVVNRGKGELPEARWNSGGHTNMLVPFYAKGRGAEIFELFAGEMDPVRGPFIQNSEIGQALFLMWGKPEVSVHRLN
jgi:alkaline phosphatase